MMLSRVAVEPGDGCVARFGDGILFSPEGGQDDALDRVLDVLQECCGGDGPSGRMLAQRLVHLLADADPDALPAFGAVARTPSGWAVILHGGVGVHTSGGDSTTRLSGLDATTWVDRIVDEPFTTLRLAGVATEPLPVAPRFDLGAGVVPGSGVVLTVAEAAPAPSRAPEKKTESTQDSTVVPPTTPPVPSDADADAEAAVLPEPPPVPVPLDEPQGDEDFESILLADGPSLTPREPLPILGLGASRDDAAAEPAGPLVDGILCERNHFNHPLVPFCSSCGVSTVHRTRTTVKGPRPTLGVVVAGDGTTYALDEDYVVGREPDLDPTVRSGARRPLVLTDPERSVSRIHAEIRLQDWDVLLVDRGSANGTLVVKPGAAEWTRLPPNVPEQIPPGTRIAFGRQVMTFDTHHRIQEASR